HTYAQIGNYTITINDMSFQFGPRVLATLPVTTSSYIQASGVQQLFVVYDAPLTARALTPPQHAAINQPINNALLFHFTDANPFAAASDFTASVDWGDQKISSSGDGTGTVSIVANVSGGFDVYGSHTYSQILNGGTLTVQVTDDGGASTSLSGAID